MEANVSTSTWTAAAIVMVQSLESPKLGQRAGREEGDRSFDFPMQDMDIDAGHVLSPIRQHPEFALSLLLETMW